MIKPFAIEVSTAINNSFQFQDMEFDIEIQF